MYQRRRQFVWDGWLTAMVGVLALLAVLGKPAKGLMTAEAAGDPVAVVGVNAVPGVDYQYVGYMSKPEMAVVYVWDGKPLVVVNKDGVVVRYFKAGQWIEVAP